jgi:hypothetical protein
MRRAATIHPLAVARILTLLLFAIAQASSTKAQDFVAASPDISVELGITAQTAADEDVAVDDSLGVVMLQSLGALPDAAEVTAYAGLLDGDHLLAFETTVELPGPVFARRGDVVRYDGVGYSIEFDASTQGVPEGAVVDAVAESAGLLLSFDTTVDLGGIVAADEDLVHWNGSSFSLVFDGSAAGIDGTLDVDAAQHLGGPNWALSFDTSGNVGGVDFGDEDVLAYNGSTWTVIYDGSAQDADWAAADLDAVTLPEPSFPLLMASGLSGLILLQRTRKRWAS